MKARLVALVLALACAAGAAAAHVRHTAAAPAGAFVVATDDPINVAPEDPISDGTWGWYDAEKALPEDASI